MLLHICCGPCSTHVAEVLSKNHEIVGYFYNPNIFPYEEWLKRYEAFKEVVARGLVPRKTGKVEKLFIDYFPKKELTKEEWKTEHQKFLEAVKGLENEPEGGKRCLVCFKLRLEEAAKFAKKRKETQSPRETESRYNFFSTTLTIGRNKRAEIINPIGESAAKKYGVKFYAADFKKQDGFLHSVKLSKEFGIYRQHYCGCEFFVNAD